MILVFRSPVTLMESEPTITVTGRGPLSSEREPVFAAAGRGPVPVRDPDGGVVLFPLFWSARDAVGVIQPVVEEQQLLLNQRLDPGYSCYYDRRSRLLSQAWVLAPLVVVAYLLSMKKEVIKHLHA